VLASSNIAPEPGSENKELNVSTLFAVIHFQVLLLNEQLSEIAERAQIGSFMETFLTDIAKDARTSAALHSLVLAV
jgi:hypothetical protein